MFLLNEAESKIVTYTLKGIIDGSSHSTYCRKLSEGWK